MITKIIDFLKKYTNGKQNTEKVEISVLQLNRVIKALEQEPVSCIDKVNFSKEDMQEVVDKKVEEITVEPRWIPVSERLPKPYTYVNATCRSLVDDRENWVVETIYLPIPKENNERGYSDWGDIPMLNWGKAEVIAWMERKIPEPYKEGKEE